eukprot:4537634-Pleurochrysis_carterae.AAC.1
MHTIGSEELGEFLRQEFARVIAVECAHDAGRRRTSRVQQCVEGGYEFSYLTRSLVLSLQQVHRLVTGVVVHDHEG